MAGVIIRQPNGLLCRYSSFVDSITNYNMTEEEYIAFRVKQAKEEAELEAREVLNGYIRPFQYLLDCKSEERMPVGKFDSIIEEMKKPANECKYTEV